jgi:hypothetical protein
MRCVRNAVLVNRKSCKQRRALIPLQLGIAQRGWQTIYPLARLDRVDQCPEMQHRDQAEEKSGAATAPPPQL